MVIIFKLIGSLKNVHQRVVSVIHVQINQVFENYLLQSGFYDTSNLKFVLVHNSKNHVLRSNHKVYET